MRGNSVQRKSDVLARLAATFINEHASRQSLITVTGATLSSDGKRATVLVTVLPESEEKSALDFLKRHRGPLREYIKKNARLRLIPSISFALDTGEKNRQRIEELSRKKL